MELECARIDIVFCNIIYLLVKASTYIFILCVLRYFLRHSIRLQPLSACLLVDALTLAQVGQPI